MSRDWLMSVRVKWDMLDFGAVKCDLFCDARDASFSIKLLCEMR